MSVITSMPFQFHNMTGFYPLLIQTCKIMMETAQKVSVLTCVVAIDVLTMSEGEVMSLIEYM